MDIFSVFVLLGGLGFFLFGMKIMSGSLEKMAGGKLEHSLKKVTANPLLGLLIGTVLTIAMQSSSATTVMLVGLVNSGIMQFSQTMGVIYGANIGTTLTAWITGLSGLDAGNNILLAMLKPANFSPLLAFIGSIILMFSKNDRKKSIANVLLGFAILMFGMELMGDAVSPLADEPVFIEIMRSMSNPLLGVLFGLGFTALIQSSAASIAILQMLALSGEITYEIAIPLVMGLNIGTCVTSVISSIGTTAAAKRVATVHVLVNVIGTVFCLGIIELADLFFDIPILQANANTWDIAIIHSIFNIATALVLFPFTKQIIRLTEHLVPEKKAQSDLTDGVPKLDDLLLRSPSIAIQECSDATKKMCSLSYTTLMDALTLLSDYDEDMIHSVLHNEDQLDLYEDKLGTYLVKLSPSALSSEDSRVINKCLHNIGDFERLGDHAVNLYKVAKEIHEKQIRFSDEANHEIAILTEATKEILRLTCNSYDNEDLAMAAHVEPLEQVIDGLISGIKSNHIQRLQRGNCTIELGFVLSDLLTNLERISDHCSNIAVAVIEVNKNSFDTHQYLNAIKHGNQEFDTIYENYNQKFTLA
jgi:phosphate:Na+ symporter